MFVVQECFTRGHCIREDLSLTIVFFIDVCIREDISLAIVFLIDVCTS